MLVEYRSFTISNGGTASSVVAVGAGEVLAVVLPATMGGNYTPSVAQTSGGTYSTIASSLIASSYQGTYLTAWDPNTSGFVTVRDLFAGAQYVKFTSSAAVGGDTVGYLVISRKAC